jgi:anti-sigma factor ChrR (cupin superfamily)
VSHIEDQLADLVLGTLGAREQEELEAHVTRCPACATEYLAVKEALSVVGWAVPQVAPPSPSVRERLMRATSGRFSRFVDQVAKVFDLARDKAAALVDKLDDPQAWEPGPLPGAAVIRVEGGPAVAGALTAFVRMDAGAQWPFHKHLGREVMLVIGGGFREPDGTEVHAGDEHVMLEGSGHSFVIFDDEPCVSAVVLWGGAEFDGGVKITV